MAALELINVEGQLRVTIPASDVREQRGGKSEDQRIGNRTVSLSWGKNEKSTQKMYVFLHVAPDAEAWAKFEYQGVKSGLLHDTFGGWGLPVIPFAGTVDADCVVTCEFSIGDKGRFAREEAASAHASDKASQDRKLNSMRTELTNAENRAKASAKEKEDAEKRAKASAKEKEDAENRAKTYAKEKEDAEQQKTTAQNKSRQLEQEKATLQQRAKQLEEQATQLERDKSAVQQRAQQLEQDKSTATRRSQELAQQLNASNASSAALEQEKLTEQQRSRQLQEQAHQLERDNAAVERRAQQLALEKAELQRSEEHRRKLLAEVQQQLVASQESEREAKDRVEQLQIVDRRVCGEMALKNTSEADWLKYYDMVVFNDGVQNLLSKGWRVLKKDKLAKSAPIVGITGEFNRGKTYVMSQLFDKQFPSGSVISTPGLCFLDATICGDRRFIVVDTAGCNSPLERISDDGLQDKKHEEIFIRGTAYEIADMFLMVVGQLTAQDQIDIRALSAKMHNSAAERRSIPLFVIHNLKEMGNIGEIEQYHTTLSKMHEGLAEWSNMEVNANGCRGNIQILKAINGTSDPFIQYQIHVLIGREGTEAGRNNALVFEFLRQTIANQYQIIYKSQTNFLDALLQSANTTLHSFLVTPPTVTLHSRHETNEGVLEHFLAPEGCAIECATELRANVAPSAPPDCAGTVSPVKLRVEYIDKIDLSAYRFLPRASPPGMVVTMNNNEMVAYLDVPGFETGKGEVKPEKVRQQGSQFSYIIRVRAARSDTARPKAESHAHIFRGREPPSKYEYEVQVPHDFDVANLKKQQQNGVMVVTIPRNREIQPEDTGF